jgi:hypothetical protein
MKLIFFVVSCFFVLLFVSPRRRRFSPLLGEQVVGGFLFKVSRPFVQKKKEEKTLGRARTTCVFDIIFTWRALCVFFVSFFSFK